MLVSIFAASLLAPAVSASAGARPIVARGDGIIRSPVNAITGSAPNLRGRQNEVDVFNQRSGTRYGIDVELGTPPQKQTLILDTGSPETWFNPTCETSNAPSDCRRFPQFDFEDSSSLEVLDETTILTYGSGNASIQYISDTLTIGSATIENQILGIATESHNIPLGIMGLSPPVQGVNAYPYILDTMKSQGLITSRAFSLDLRGVDNPSGALIFGGIDTGKYIGELAKLPIIPAEDTPLGADRYYVTMTGVGLTLPEGNIVRSEELATPVFLDSGATLSHLPTRIYQALADSFPDAVFDPGSGYYLLPCEVTEEPGSVDFYFEGKTIRVPFNEFIWQTGGFCILGVLPDDDEAILGDTFLRAAYVVYDQDQRNLHIAQAANCGENLVAIGEGEDAVPSLTGDCTALPTATGTGDNLDLTRTRGPVPTFTGTPPIVDGGGPGPAGPGGPRGSGTETGSGSEPTTDSGENAAGRGFEVGLGALLAFGVVHGLAWVF